MTPTLFRYLLRSLASALALLALTASVVAQTSTRSTSSTSSSSASRPTSSTGNSSSGGSSSGARQYNSNTLLGNASIQIDPETRSVVVVTDEETNVEIGKLIANLDQPKPQVLIKVVFVEVTLDNSTDVGVEGSYTFKVGNGSTSSSGSSVSTTTKTTYAPGGNTSTTTSTTNPAGINSSAATLKQLYGLSQMSTGSFLALTNGNWAATLYALNTHNNVHVLSRPSIMARNNQQAAIVVGQEVPFVTNSQITDTGQINNTIQYQDVGIILRVTPFISANKTVEMIIAPEISSVDAATVQVSTNVNAPIIDKRAAETVVVTPDATTTVIGGLMQKQATSTIQKIPVLGDIPGLGYAFRHTTKDETKTELLIFLTPYIVENPAMLKQITRDTATKADLTQESMYKQEFNQSLETMQLPTLDGPSKKTPPAKSSPTPKPKDDED